MFTILAIGVGISYFALGWASNTVSYVSAPYHHETNANQASTSPQLTEKNTSETSSQNLSPTTTTKITPSAA